MLKHAYRECGGSTQMALFCLQHAGLKLHQIMHGPSGICEQRFHQCRHGNWRQDRAPHLPDDKHLCVRSGVLELLHQIVRSGDNVAIMNKDCAYWHFASCCSLHRDFLLGPQHPTVRQWLSHEAEFAVLLAYISRVLHFAACLNKSRAGHLSTFL